MGRQELQDKIEFAKTSLSRNDSWIRFSDTKTGFFFAFTGLPPGHQVRSPGIGRCFSGLGLDEFYRPDRSAAQHNLRRFSGAEFHGHLGPDHLARLRLSGLPDQPGSSFAVCHSFVCSVSVLLLT